MRSDTRLVAALALAAVAALWPARAHAFADATQFFEQQANPHAATFGASSEGLYFTGAPRWASLDCSTCHQAGPQKIGLRLNANDPDLFATGYVPGKVYQLQVEMTNEVEGLTWNTPNHQCTDPPAPDDTFTYVQCNNNGFGLEIDYNDATTQTQRPLVPDGAYVPYCAAQPKGTMCPMPDYTSDQTLVAPGGDAIFDAKVYLNTMDPNLAKTITSNGATSWSFYWTAPKAGTGALTVYVGAVDGNGGGGDAINDQDPYNDDTVSANFFLQESGAPVNRSASAGCAVGSGAGGAPLALAVPLALFACGASLLRRRARRRERARG